MSAYENQPDENEYTEYVHALMIKSNSWEISAWKPKLSVAILSYETAVSTEEALSGEGRRDLRSKGKRDGREGRKER